MTNDEVNKRIAELRGDGPDWAPGRLRVDVLPHPQYTDDWAACGVLLEELLRDGQGDIEWDDGYVVAYGYSSFIASANCCDAIARAWLAWKEGE